MKVLALALLLVVAPALSGCALPNRGPCDWVILQAYPSPFNASNLSMAVYSANCATSDVPLGTGDCFPLEPMYPRARIGEATYVLGVTASAIPEDALPCSGVPEGGAPYPPRTGPSISGLTWNGTIREGNETRPAPPGEYAIRAEAFGRIDVARVRLHEDGTFSGGKQQ